MENNVAAAILMMLLTGAYYFGYTAGIWLGQQTYYAGVNR